MFKCYIAIVGILILHELGHYISLKIFRVEINQIVIGNILSLKIRKLKLSPIVLSCHVDFSMEDYEKLNLISKLIIIISGPLMNFFLVFLLPNHEATYRLFSFMVGISSLLPIPFLETDGSNIIKEIFIELKKIRIAKLQ
jgi:membrane-associated protease RseP (regulator of RpoE activity)